VAHDFRRTAITILESLGISVEFSHHEGAPGQQEIDLRYADALTTADNIMTFRLVMKEVALEQGVYASFMPKPYTDHPGSGMHTHLSLFDGDRNAFYEAGSEYQLSKIGRAFIAGLLKHAGEITAVTNQWVNSYKRLWGGAKRTAGAGGEAPAYVCWGHNNRSALIRVPMYKPQKGQSTRIEVRSLDSACNPYLAFALLLSAGLKGVEEGYELPPGAEDDVWRLTDAERRAMGIEPLPQNLSEAITLMERSELVAETLGEHVFDFFLRNKRGEWQDYRVQVTPYELDSYLPVL
jgi:glutamine synthetase